MANVVYNTESQIPLGANASVSGEVYDGKQAGGEFSLFRCAATSDQAGTIQVAQSPDGINWFTSTSVAVAAGTTIVTVLESLWTMRYVRVIYTNGTTIQTMFNLYSQFVTSD